MEIGELGFFEKFSRVQDRSWRRAFLATKKKRRRGERDGCVRLFTSNGYIFSLVVRLNA